MTVDTLQDVLGLQCLVMKQMADMLGKSILRQPEVVVFLS